MNCGSDDSLDITDAITIEVWVKRNSFGDHRQTIVANSLGGSDGYMFEFQVDNTLRFNRYTIKDYISIASVTDMSWHHIVVVIDESHDARFYLDGEHQDTINCSVGGKSTAGETLIGANAGGYCFNGTIDEVRIYDAALEASQIKARYVEGLDKLHTESKIDGKEYYQRLTEMRF